MLSSVVVAPPEKKTDVADALLLASPSVQLKAGDAEGPSTAMAGGGADDGLSLKGAARQDHAPRHAPPPQGAYAQGQRERAQQALPLGLHAQTGAPVAGRDAARRDGVGMGGETVAPPAFSFDSESETEDDETETDETETDEVMTQDADGVETGLPGRNDPINNSRRCTTIAERLVKQQMGGCGAFAASWVAVPELSTPHMHYTRGTVPEASR